MTPWLTCVCTQPALVDEAVGCVLSTIALCGGNKLVLAAAVKSLLSLSGCLNCRCIYDDDK
jgi:hypothetical protein